MLQVQDICKEYRTGELVQQALDHVSLNLRDNEFVAILGPSGSGKTTLLNIIGGLDRYDSGDLIINGISTKQYKDRDWDSYRNHTIGFVFQSYNLIPHQNILANVELALTISGISGAERRQKAIASLEKVGLKDHIHKKPNQLSGGQMQRVAIARALVNDPDILLADEPTGALDSETSVQVMDLLKEVAEDRLVVMVTHNPELAEQYATRIVRLKDGVILSDTDPYHVEAGEAVHKNLGKSSMSFLTSLSLSFNNLRTKLTRTLLVAFAGSIGIIGIALILSLSNGVNRYIQDIEEETLQEYPLTIQNSAFDSTFLLTMGTQEEEEPSEVHEMRTITSLFSRLSSNDLASLKIFLESPESGMKPYTRAIEYSYDLSPLIYRFDGKDYRQVNPNQVFASMGFSSNMIYSSAMSTDLFHVLPEHEELYREQYLLESGRWPENAEEAVLVLTRNGGVSDLSLYAMGIKDQKELDELMKAFSSGENVTIEGEIGKYSYKDFLGISFRVIDAWQRYSYDEEYKVYVDKSSDGSYMRSLLKEAPQLTIVGVVRPSEEASVAILESGISFPSELIRNMMERSAGSTIVRAQKADPDTDVITGQKFGEAGKGTLDMSTLFSIDEQAMNDAFSFDTSKLRIDASAFDMSSLDMSSLIDPNALSSAMPELDLGSLLSQVKIDLDEEELQKLFESLLQEYAEYAKADPQTDITALPDAFRSYLQSDEARALLQQDLAAFLKDSGLDQISAEDLTQLISEVMAGYPQWAMEKGYNDPEQFSTYIAEYLQLPEVQQLITAKDSELIGEIDPEVVEKAAGQIGSDLLNGYQEYASGKELPQPEKISASFGTYLQSEGAQKQISDFLQKSVDTSEVEKAVASQMSSYSDELAKQIGGGMQKMASQLADGMQKAVSSMGGSFMDAFRFDASSFSNAISMNFSEEELQELLSSLMANETSSYNGNLKLFGYADPDQPYMITIFPYDFAGKGEIKNILDAYNDDMRETDKEKVIVYTDIVGTLMSSVTDIINAIGYVLIAFVAISLVVSSIMIGVITYISVLERRKEIGILRAIGASKRNISEVFNAETFIIGLLAGVLGIVISELLLIPGNALIHHLTDADVTAYLEPSSAVILVILSVVLTLIGGLIPSRKAAHSDPVTALRTE